MNEKTIDQYFASVRSLPLAMGLDEIQALVKMNPVLTGGRPRSSWWTLKNIIFMIAVATIITTVILFVSPSKKDIEQPIKQEQMKSLPKSETVKIKEHESGMMKNPQVQSLLNSDRNSNNNTSYFNSDLSELNGLLLYHPLANNITNGIYNPEYRMSSFNGGNVSWIPGISKQDEKDPPTKTIEKEIAVEGAEWLFVHNKGDIRIETWDQEKVQLQAFVTIEGDDVEKAIADFDLNLVKNGNKIEIVKTGWDQVGEDCDCSTFKIKAKGKNKKNETIKIKKFQADYVLKVPKNLNLNLEGKYGKIDLAGTDGEIVLKSFQGIINAGDQKGRLTPDCKYSTATIGNFNSGDINLFQSKARLGTCEDLKLVAKYSNVHLEKAVTIDLEAFQSDLNLEKDIDQLKGSVKYGDFVLEGNANRIVLDVFQGKIGVKEVAFLEWKGAYSTLKANLVKDLFTSGGVQNKFSIGELTKLKGEEKYPSIEISTLYGSMSLQIFQGNLEVEKVAGEFSLIDIQSKYTDIDLNFASDSKFNFEATTDYSTLNYSSDMQVNFKEEVNSKLNVRGVYNVNNTKKSSVVNLVSFQGKLDLK